jgi:hypothetical protein
MSNEQFQSQSQFQNVPTAREPSEAVVDRLMRRVQVLEEDKQWWKRAALIAFALFFLAFIGGTVVTVGGGVVYLSVIERQNAVMLATEQMQALQAQRQAELARQQAEQAQAEADRLAAEIARQRQKELEHPNK